MDFNFTSQICTTKEQSDRLLALGLKKETADMKHFFDDRDDYSFFHCWKCCPYKWHEESLTDSENIPAWSLHRLIEILDIWYLDLNFHNFANAYEQVISYFEERVKGGFINKKYLEE